MQKSKANKPGRNPLASYARYSALAFQMGIIIAAGAFGGYFTDEWLNFRVPVFTILLSLGAVAGAIWLLIKEITNLNK
jgi:general stress protein CsbA